MIDLLRVPAWAWGPALLSVSQANTHIKALLDDDPILSDCWIRGEVGDARTYASGHTYFTLRDGTGQLKCVLFRQKSRGLEPLENGRLYVVHGSISVYPASGVYQLYVDDHRPLGIGELYQEFELLKSRLEAEGLFAAERKRPLPRWPQRIGMVTSPQGAVLHDLRQVIGRRLPLAELVLAPCQVQGAEAVRSVVLSLRALDAAGVDVIVVARGGGSLEDLWAFNEEPVARAIAAARVPVVSAIGHETDFTIADFVADLRAPTPSAAAEVMVPDAADLHRQIADLAERAARAMKAQLWLAQSDFADHEARLQRTLAAHLERANARLTALEGRLQALSPLSVLARGYAVVRDGATGAVIRSAAQTAAGQALGILLHDGQLKVMVTSAPPADAGGANAAVESSEARPELQGSAARA
jgi:exodeoxyribonuclease VII large subunit